MTIVLMLYLMGHVNGIPVDRFDSWQACAEAKYRVQPNAPDRRAWFVCEEVGK